MNKKAVNKVSNLFDSFLEFLGSLSGYIIIAVMLIVCAQVVARYFFRSPIQWVVEFSQFALLYIPLLGSAWLLKHEGHVSVDLLTHRLNPKSLSLLKFFTSLVGIMVSLVLVWYGGRVTVDLFQRDILIPEVVPIPEYIIVGIIPFGGLLMFIQFIRRAKGCFIQWNSLRKEEHSSDPQSPQN